MLAHFAFSFTQDGEERQGQHGASQQNEENRTRKGTEGIRGRLVPRVNHMEREGPCLLPQLCQRPY